MKPASRIISILMLVHVQGGHRDLLLLDVTSMSLGVKLFDGSMEVLIPRCVHVLVFFVCLFCLLCACVFCVCACFVCLFVCLRACVVMCLCLFVCGVLVFLCVLVVCLFVYLCISICFCVRLCVCAAPWKFSFQGAVYPLLLF